MATAPGVVCIGLTIARSLEDVAGERRGGLAPGDGDVALARGVPRRRDPTGVNRERETLSRAESPPTLSR